MRRTTVLDTYGRRSLRFSDRRKRFRTRVMATTLVIAACIAVAGIAWANIDRDAPQAARGKADVASATTTRVAAVSAKPTSPSPDSTRSTSTSMPPADPARVATLTVAGVGDMLFDRNVKNLIRKSGGSAPLARVAARLAAADIACGNLETVLATSGTRNPVKEPKYAFRGDPAAIEGLKLAGFDFLSLANNHVLDYGAEPLADTTTALDRAGIGHAGAGANLSAAWAPAIAERDGATVAYLAFSHIIPPGYIAQANRAGLASGRQDQARTVNAIKTAKKSNDYVIVSFHWGVEYQDNANGTQQRWAREAIDAGADMVLAHHPHVIQGIEFYRNRLIAYSLGDFVFDHYSRKTGEAFVLEARMGQDGVTDVTATPVYLDSYGRPEYVSESAATTILKRLAQISAPYGTDVAIDGNTARITP